MSIMLVIQFIRICADAYGIFKGERGKTPGNSIPLRGDPCIPKGLR